MGGGRRGGAPRVDTEAAVGTGVVGGGQSQSWRASWSRTVCKKKRQRSGPCSLAAEPAAPQNVLFLILMLQHYSQALGVWEDLWRNPNPFCGPPLPRHWCIKGTECEAGPSCCHCGRPRLGLSGHLRGGMRARGVRAMKQRHHLLIMDGSNDWE